MIEDRLQQLPELLDDRLPDGLLDRGPSVERVGARCAQGREAT